MKPLMGLLMVVAVLGLIPADADYTVQQTGTWPATWPAELEPLRAQARTFEGPLPPLLHHAIPFADRESFEAAWPQILSVKSRGAPVVLRRGPSFWLDDGSEAGVCIHTPPAGEVPRTTESGGDDRVEPAIYLELIVDGQIVDLNRIPLPPDTPIIDQRFVAATGD